MGNAKDLYHQPYLGAFCILEEANASPWASEDAFASGSCPIAEGEAARRMNLANILNVAAAIQGVRSS